MMYTYIYIYKDLVGGLEHHIYFSIYWECHHPNWRTHIFQRGWNHQPDMLDPHFGHPPGGTGARKARHGAWGGMGRNNESTMGKTPFSIDAIGKSQGILIYQSIYLSIYLIWSYLILFYLILSLYIYISIYINLNLDPITITSISDWCSFTEIYHTGHMKLDQTLWKSHFLGWTARNPPFWIPVYQAEPIYSHVAVLSLMPNISDRARKHG